MKWILNLFRRRRQYLPAPAAACSRNKTQCLGGASGR